MKTLSIIMITALLSGFFSIGTGLAFGAGHILAVLFAIGLVVWTFEQYGRTPRSLYRAPVRSFPSHAMKSGADRQPDFRLAA